MRFDRVKMSIVVDNNKRVVKVPILPVAILFFVVYLLIDAFIFVMTYLRYLIISS